MTEAKRSTNANESRAQQAALERYTLMVHVLDQVFRVPGTSWRFGLDAIVGLVPGVGDALMALAGAYGIAVARQLGAPASVQLRMMLNLGIDAAVGAIPILGDIFDFAFKAHVRNRVLLERWLMQPHRTHRTSAALLIGMFAILLAIVIGALWLAALGFYALVRWAGGG